MDDDTGQQGRLAEPPSPDQASPPGHSLLGPGGHSRRFVGGYQRANFRFWQEWVACPQSRDAFREALEELFFEGRVDVDALNRNAHLSRVIVATLCQGLDDPIQVGLSIDDHWCYSAVLERTAGTVRQLGAERPADLGRTDEAEK